MKKMLNKASTFNSIYMSFWVSKFINKFIMDGKKDVVKRHVYLAFNALKQELHYRPQDILLTSLQVLKPIVGTAKLIRKYGKKRQTRTLLVPIPLKLRSQLILSLSWLKDFIIIQKKSRRQHHYINRVKENKKTRGLSKSKKKTFGDRFYISLSGQQLNKLVENKFRDFFLTKYSQLIRRKLALYISATNNRVYTHFRWS